MRRPKRNTHTHANVSEGWQRKSDAVCPPLNPSHTLRADAPVRCMWNEFKVSWRQVAELDLSWERERERGVEGQTLTLRDRQICIWCRYIFRIFVDFLPPSSLLLSLTSSILNISYSQLAVKNFCFCTVCLPFTHCVCIVRGVCGCAGVCKCVFLSKIQISCGLHTHKDTDKHKAERVVCNLRGCFAVKISRL